MIRAIDDREHLRMLVCLAKRIRHRPANYDRTVASRNYRGDERLGHCLFLINCATTRAVTFLSSIVVREGIDQSSSVPFQVADRLGCCGC